MNEIFDNLKNRPWGVKAPLVAVFFLVIYLVINSVSGFILQRGVEKEISEFKFSVSKIYFETRFNLRNYKDTYIFLELNEGISPDQFKKLTFEIPEEKVIAEQVESNKIKINLNSPFRKGISSSLKISYLGKRVYLFNFNHSELGEDDFKQKLIDEPDKF